MFDFAEATKEMSAIEILNYYRNLYYAEPQVTERGIIANAINDYITADVQKVKHAKNLCEDYPSLFECSLCRWCDDDTTTGSTSVYNYCPNCGAKMDGGKHEI